MIWESSGKILVNNKIKKIKEKYCKQKFILVQMMLHLILVI